MSPRLVKFTTINETVIEVNHATYHIRKILGLARQYLENDEMLVNVEEFINEVICYVDAYPDKFRRVRNVTETALTVKVARLVIEHIKQHYLL